MKPEKLIICGWGPYRTEEEIDFARLGGQGLFLITGPTGAGKTTVFDAISYALFGEINGNMRSKDSVRSDFADAETGTYVDFTMTHAGKMYRVVRNPQYERPKKRKNGTRTYTMESENAVLYWPDGSVTEGNKEVNRRMRELLAMDFEQFRQISMIAQGEFIRLLTASSKEKTQIFRNIFGTHIYEVFAAILHKRAAGLFGQISEYQNKMDETIETLALEEEAWKELTKGEGFAYDRIKDYLETQLIQKKGEIRTAEEVKTKAEKKLLKAEKAIEEGKRIHALVKELREAEEKTRELKAHKESVEQKKANVLLAERAEKVSAFALRKNEMQKQLLQTREQKKQVLSELSALQETKHEGSAQFEHQGEVKEALLMLSELTEKRIEIRQKEETSAQKQKLLEAKQVLYLQWEEKAGKDKAVYEQAEAAYKRAIVGIVAKQIKKSSPCPVCGSLIHPRVTQTVGEVPSEETLKSLRVKSSESTAQQMLLHGEAAAAQSEAKASESDREELAVQIRIKEKTMAGISDIITMLASRYLAKDFLQPHIQAEVKAALQKQEEHLQQIRQITADITAKEEWLAILRAEEEKQDREWEESRKAYEKKLTEYGFATEEVYLTSIMTEQALYELRTQITLYEQQAVSNADHVIRMRKALQGKKEEALEILLILKEEALKEKKEAQEVYGRTQIIGAQTEKALLSLRVKLREADKLKAEYGIVKDLDNITAGNNPKRLVFEQFVLAGCFDRVLRAANLRLRKMTSGRYELMRAQGVSDGRTKDNFEIQVLDYYTGKQRSVKTLSGGEMFNASLSLALGLSDVMQAESGGIKVETLFIDEGFGSLDTESLDQACQTLQQLVENKRFIGIISHVPELRERIDKQIIVEKTNIGSHVTMIA